MQTSGIGSFNSLNFFSAARHIDEFKAQLLNDENEFDHGGVQADEEEADTARVRKMLQEEAVQPETYLVNPAGRDYSRRLAYLNEKISTFSMLADYVSALERSTGGAEERPASAESAIDEKLIAVLAFMIAVAASFELAFNESAT